MNAKARVITLLACAMTLTTMIGSGVAHADDVGGTPAEMKPRFVTRCTFSHRRADDPIVHPDQPGASHSHDFFGNRTTNAFSTLKSMKKGTTTCKNQLDLSGYWTPSLKVNGVTVNPTQVSVYYSSNGKPFDKIKTPKKGLKIVAGSAMATAPQGTKITSWDCADDNTVPNGTSSADLSAGHSRTARQLPRLLGRRAPRLTGPPEPPGVRRARARSARRPTRSCCRGFASTSATRPPVDRRPSSRPAVSSPATRTSSTCGCRRSCVAWSRPASTPASPATPRR